MKSSSQNNTIAGGYNNPNSSNNSGTNIRVKGSNLIQKPMRTECSPKNYSNNSFTLNHTQPFQLNVKRNSIEPTSISQRLVQNTNKRNNVYHLQQNAPVSSSKEKENVNQTFQFSTINHNKGASNVQAQTKGTQIILQNSQNSVMNTSGSNLYSSRVTGTTTTHQFEQKLIQQQQSQQMNNSQVQQQLTIQPIDFLDMFKGDLKLSQVLSPTSPTKLNSSNSSQSKERIQSSKNLSKINCKNHTTIQASYYAIENRVVSYFCNQCSTVLVKKGLKLHEIINSQLTQKRPLHQISLNTFNQNTNIIQNTSTTGATPMKLSLGQHKMINLSNQAAVSKVNQQRNISIATNVTNSPGSQILTPSSSILTPRQQSVTIPVSVFEPFSNHMEVPLSQQQTPTLNTLHNNDEDYEEPFEITLARNNIKELSGDKAKVREYLEDLMNKIDNIKALSFDKLEKLENKKLQLHDFYEFQKQITLEKMLELITIIEQEKQASLKNIEIQKNDSISEINSLESNIKQQVKDIKNISSDIKDNICNIFNNLDLKPFKVIYNKYIDKLEQFSSNIRKVDLSHVNHSVLNPTNISSYLKLLSSQLSKPFSLEHKSETLSFNLIQNLQNQFPETIQNKSSSLHEEKHNFNKGMKNSSILQQVVDKVNLEQQTPQSKKVQKDNSSSDISQEDTPRNNDKNKMISQDQQNNRTTVRENQVYVSFNNKNIFQNDLANQVETLNDEQHSESIPIVNLGLNQNKVDGQIQNQNAEQAKKKKMQTILIQDNDDNEKGIFTIKEEDANNNSLLNQLSSHQLNSNQFNSISSNPYNCSNQFNSNQMIDSLTQNINKLDQSSTQAFANNNNNLINSQNEYGLTNNLSKESIDIINLDSYKQNLIHKQTSPSRNSFNSQNGGGGKGRALCKSPNSLKYLELIDKINTNQLNTNIFYQTLIKDNQIVSSCSENSQNTFTVQLQKQSTTGSTDPSKTSKPQLYGDLNTSLNIQTSQVIFNDPVQKNNNSILEIGTISPISVTPSSNYYISSVPNTCQSKPVFSPTATITKTINFPTTQHQQPQQQYNYQKKLF